MKCFLFFGECLNVCINRCTFMYEQFPEVMNMLWARMLRDNKKNWRRVYKVSYRNKINLLNGDTVFLSMCGTILITVIKSEVSLVGGRIRPVTFCFNRCWTFLFQALLLLAHLIRNGSERVVTSTREHLYDLRSLESYHFVGMM